MILWRTIGGEQNLKGFKWLLSFCRRQGFPFNDMPTENQLGTINSHREGSIVDYICHYILRNIISFISGSIEKLRYRRGFHDRMIEDNIVKSPKCCLKFCSIRILAIEINYEIYMHKVFIRLITTIIINITCVTRPHLQIKSHSLYLSLANS